MGAFKKREKESFTSAYGAQKTGVGREFIVIVFFLLVFGIARTICTFGSVFGDCIFLEVMEKELGRGRRGG